MKSTNDVFLNALTIFLLCITPVLCLYNSHNYPLFSNAFLFFTLMSLLVTVLSLWFCRFRIFRWLIFIMGIAVLIRFLTGSSLNLGLGIGFLFILLLREKANVVIITMTLVIGLSSFVAIEKNYPDYVIRKSEERQVPSSGNQNPVIHLIFDEAAGISSLNRAGKQGEAALIKLINTLSKHGFTIVRDAHSSSKMTKFSLAHMINLQEVETSHEDGEWDHFFDRNPLFELLNKKGYQINVIQSAYLDFCASSESHIRSCYEYPMTSLSYFNDTGLNQLSLMVPVTLDRLNLLHRFNRLLPKSNITEKFGFHQRMPKFHVSLSQQILHSEFIARLEEDRTSKNQYYFVHFLYPHHYFYQTGDCGVKPKFSDWGDIGRLGSHRGEQPELRVQDDVWLERYGKYFEQFECFTKELDSLLSETLAIYPDATIILHGDHSSRITTVYIDDLNMANFADLDQQNYSDLYSTLFAVKYPGNVPGIVNCRISLVEFAQYFFQGQVGVLGEKTRIIADHLFPYSEVCVDQLPTLPIIK